MQSIEPIKLEDAEGTMLRLLETVRPERASFFAEDGSLCRMIQTLGRSPRGLDAYLQFHRAIASGKLGAKMREQIALAVAQVNNCEYSLAQHASVARRLGITNEEIAANRDGRSADRKLAVVLKFARNASGMARGGETSVQELRDAGYEDAEIIEMVAQVALNVFENCFNQVAGTELDFPRVGLAAKAA
jgi:AhpD family alkylhydroperoxidase